MKKAVFFMGSLLLCSVSNASQETFIRARDSSEVYRPYQWIRIWAQCLLNHVEPLDGKMIKGWEANFWNLIWMTREIFEDAQVVKCRDLDTSFSLVAGTEMDNFMRFEIRRVDEVKWKLLLIFELKWIDSELKGTMTQHATSAPQREWTAKNALVFQVRKVTPIVDEYSERPSYALQFEFYPLDNERFRGEPFVKAPVVLKHENLHSKELMKIVVQK